MIHFAKPGRGTLRKEDRINSKHLHMGIWHGTTSIVVIHHLVQSSITPRSSRLYRRQGNYPRQILALTWILTRALAPTLSCSINFGGRMAVDNHAMIPSTVGNDCDKSWLYTNWALVSPKLPTVDHTAQARFSGRTSMKETITHFINPGRFHHRHHSNKTQ